MSRLPRYITVTTPGVLGDNFDAQGNPVRGADIIETVLVKGFSPRESSDTAEPFGTRSISGGTVYGYTGTAISPDAIITIDGIDYHMDGELGEWDPAYTSGLELGTKGVEFAVKRAS